MTIASALNNALSGLTATGKLAEITSGNLANTLTDGYGRQSVTLSAAVLGGYGNGVAVAGVDRASSPDSRAQPAAPSSISSSSIGACSTPSRCRAGASW